MRFESKNNLFLNRKRNQAEDVKRSKENFPKIEIEASEVSLDKINESDWSKEFEESSKTIGMRANKFSSLGNKGISK